MAKYVLLRIEDDSEADDLLRELVTCPHPAVLTPLHETPVYVELMPGLDSSDDVPSLGRELHGADLESVVRRSYERASELAAEWETAG